MATTAPTEAPTGMDGRPVEPVSPEDQPAPGMWTRLGWYILKTLGSGNLPQ